MESCVKLEMLGGGVFDVVFIFGCWLGVNFEYYGFCDGDVGDLVLFCLFCGCCCLVLFFLLLFVFFCVVFGWCVFVGEVSFVIFLNLCLLK